MKKISIIILGALLLFGSIDVKAQIPDKAKYLQSIFIFNFMIKIQWPDAYRSGDFIIGVLGDTPLKKQLDNLATSKKINSRTIVVKQFQTVEEMTPTHLLFIPSGSECQKKLEDAVIKIGHRQGTLIVTEHEGILDKGSVINFILRQNKIRFEINDEIAERYGFKVSALKKFLN